MSRSKNILQRQLEEQRFLHGVSYVEQAAGGIKKISSSELAHLNQILTGSAEEPWRFEEVQIQIPSGKTHHFNIISNPINRAREIIGDALQTAGNQEPIEGALFLYSQLVLEHLFKDANRRTAVLAMLWVLRTAGLVADAQALLNTPIGDLRNASDLQILSQKLRFLLKKAP